jgi:hypothetical protein
VSAVEKHVPKHRAPAKHRAPRKSAVKSTVKSTGKSTGTALRTSLTLSTMAVVGTGLAITSGAALGGSSPGDAELVGADLSQAVTKAEPSASVDTTALTATRDALVSRSDRREEADPLKADVLAIGGAADNALTRTEDLSDEDPRTIARALLAEFGFGEDQFGCLDSLWEKESHWNVYADNPSSSAYGIPQALPGSKMSSAGPDWATNPVTQIRWGLGYIQDRYGSPCSAWGHSQSHNWY